MPQPPAKRTGAGGRPVARGACGFRTPPGTLYYLPIMKTLIPLLIVASGLLLADEIDPAELAKDLENKVGEEVTFTDELLLKTKKQEVKGYVKFETVNLRCLIAEDKKEVIEMLETLLDERSPRKARITGTPTKKKALQTFIEVTSIERPKYKRSGS